MGGASPTLSVSPATPSSVPCADALGSRALLLLELGLTLDPDASGGVATTGVVGRLGSLGEGDCGGEGEGMACRVVDALVRRVAMRLRRSGVLREERARWRGRGWGGGGGVCGGVIGRVRERGGVGRDFLLVLLLLVDVLVVLVVLLVLVGESGGVLGGRGLAGVVGRWGLVPEVVEVVWRREGQGERLAAASASSPLSRG